MSQVKQYYEQRAEQLGLDPELTDDTIQKIIEADLKESEKIEIQTLEKMIQQITSRIK